MIATSLASATRPLWRLLERHQINPVHVFRESGLDPALMDKPRARYKVKRVVAAWRTAAELIDDPCFGLKLAEVWSPTDLHALGYAFLASSTLRTALARLCRYVRVLDDAVELNLVDGGQSVALSVSTESALFLPPLPSEEDGNSAFVTSICRMAYGETLDPVEVRFQHEEPPCSAEYYGYFRCPVRFGAEQTVVLFSGADLDRPLPAVNLELARANDHILANLIDELTDDDLVSRVKAAIAEELPSGSPTDVLIAKMCYTSPRTLHRRLSELGTNYSTLLNDLRRDLAAKYIADSSLSFSEISFLLGFAELSSFSRAFKRWTGKSPKAAREAATT